ncbi:MAG TPA: PfkB family carbohydrate kinase [Gaiellales bacterium]|nr:PfkB family carbohydrate kinase [Gaiellales bacterium]
MLDLLVIGDCNPDLLVAGADVVPEFGQREKLVDTGRLLVGGSASIFACGAARLGLAVALVATVGDDAFGSFMLEQVGERGVDTSGCRIVAGVDTGLTVALVRDGDRAMLTAPGAIPLLTAEMVPPALVASARHLHVASYHLLDGLRPGLPALVAAAHAAGATVSVNPQGEVGDGGGAELRALVPEIDLLLLNEQEHRSLGTVDGPLVVVKRGADGAVVHSAAGGVVRAAAHAVEAVDTTGAGDSFDAGFLAAWLAGEPPERALALGNACGALSTRALGGITAQATMAEARAAAA